MTHYEQLDVSENATREQIKTAFRAAAKKWHPDRNADPESISRFRDAYVAYDILYNLDKRATYDSLLACKRKTAGAEGQQGATSTWERDLSTRINDWERDARNRANAPIDVLIEDIPAKRIVAGVAGAFIYGGVSIMIGISVIAVGGSGVIIGVIFIGIGIWLASTFLKMPSQTTLAEKRMKAAQAHGELIKCSDKAKYLAGRMMPSIQRAWTSDRISKYVYSHNNATKEPSIEGFAASIFPELSLTIDTMLSSGFVFAPDEYIIDYSSPRIAVTNRRLWVEKTGEYGAATVNLNEIVSFETLTKFTELGLLGEITDSKANGIDRFVWTRIVLSDGKQLRLSIGNGGLSSELMRFLVSSRCD